MSLFKTISNKHILIVQLEVERFGDCIQHSVDYLSGSSSAQNCRYGYTHLFDCFTPVVPALQTCLESDNKNQINIFYDVLDVIGNFMCHRDGDRWNSTNLYIYTGFFAPAYFFCNSITF